MDRVTKAKRSAIMSRVRGKNSQMEVLARKALSQRGLRYRKNVSYLLGKPDVAFIGKKVVIFWDSCFWHGCRRHGSIPLTNREFWINKIDRNKKRDKIVNAGYKRKGWKVLRFWEHDLKKDPISAVDKIMTFL